MELSFHVRREIERGCSRCENLSYISPAAYFLMTEYRAGLLEKHQLAFPTKKEAIETASRKARQTGDRYVVFQAIAVVERDTPPVKVTEIKEVA